MKKSTIDKALPIVAAHYGGKFGVKVILGTRDQAGTDGKTIYLPAIDHEAIWGLLCHEAQHVKSTDFFVWSGVLGSPALRRTILNIFEDGRIEHEIMSLYPGTKRDLETTVRWMKAEGKFKSVTANDEPGLILQAKLLYAVRANWLGQPVDDLHAAADKALRAVFPKGVSTRLEVLLHQASGTQSTLECLKLTDKVLAMLDDEAQKEAGRQAKSGKCKDQSKQDNSQAQAGDDSDSDAPDDDDADDPADSDSVGSDDDDADNSADSDSGASGDDDADNSADSKAGADQSRQNAMLDAMDALGDELMPDAFEALKRELFEAAAEVGDNTFLTVPIAPSCRGNEAQGLLMLDQVRSTTTKLRAQLLSLVQASRRNRECTKRHGRKLDGKRLTRIVSGDMRIFRQRENRTQPDTAVHVLTDLSSSMTGRSALVAQQASLAIALALEGIPGVNPAVTFFCGYRNDPVRSALRHGERIRENVSRFAMAANGSTPMAEAIWHAAFELTKTRERRKQIIVITDGDPNNVPACHAVLDLCRNSGIEVMGIGICHNVDRLFDRHIAIGSIEELRGTLFKLMREQLTTDAA